MITSSNYGVLGCAVEVVTEDRTTFLVTCPETGLETLWSTTEQDTFKTAVKEHLAAHEKKQDEESRSRDLAAAHRNARYIYRTTEPGNPARRGIGPYL